MRWSGIRDINSRDVQLYINILFLVIRMISFMPARAKVRGALIAVMDSRVCSHAPSSGFKMRWSEPRKNRA